MLKTLLLLAMLRKRTQDPPDDPRVPAPSPPGISSLLPSLTHFLNILGALGPRTAGRSKDLGGWGLAPTGSRHDPPRSRTRPFRPSLLFCTRRKGTRRRFTAVAS